jgi:hypothetical protein
MVQTDSRSAAHAEVLRRVFDLAGQGLTRPLAESILALDFPDHDAERLEELSGKANEGRLTDSEEAELEAYINVGDLLALWQSKARQALQQPAVFSR